MKKIIVLFLTLSFFSCKKEPISINVKSANTGSVVDKEIIFDGHDSLYKISIKNDNTGNIFDYFLKKTFINLYSNGIEYEYSYITPTYSFSGVQTGFYDDSDNYQDINSILDYPYTFPQNSSNFQGGGQAGGGITITFNVINSSHRNTVDDIGIVGCISNEELYNSLNIGDKQSVYKIPNQCSGMDNTVNNFCSEPYLW